MMQAGYLKILTAYNKLLNEDSSKLSRHLLCKSPASIGYLLAGRWGIPS